MASDWTLEVNSNTGGGEAGPLCPAGTFPAVVVAVVDVGTHPKTDRATQVTSDKRRLVLVYELGYPQPDGWPFAFVEELTASLNARATLNARMTSILGPLPDGGTRGLLSLLGQQCSVSVIHDTGQQGDRMFANLKSVSGVIYGMPPVQPRHQPFLWKLDDGVPLPDVSWIPKCFGKSIPAMLAASHEGKAGRVPGLHPTGPRQPAPAQHQQPAPEHPVYNPGPQHQPQGQPAYQQPHQAYAQPAPQAAPQQPQTYVQQPAPQQPQQLQAMQQAYEQQRAQQAYQQQPPTPQQQGYVTPVNAPPAWQAPAVNPQDGFHPPTGDAQVPF